MVLPILVRWVARVEDERLRHCIYSRFEPPYAKAHIDDLLDWWERESYKLGVESIAQILSRLISEQHAERVWRVIERRPNAGFNYKILAKLTEFPKVSQKVKDTIVSRLKEGRLIYSDLQDISTVPDRRIREWFAAQTDSKDRLIRALARRISSIPPKLPTGLYLAPEMPKRGRPSEIDSIEVDIGESTAYLKKLSKMHGLKIPSAFKKCDFLEVLKLDTWYVTSVATDNGPSMLWFRLEDEDVVEILLTLAGAADPN